MNIIIITHEQLHGLGMQNLQQINRIKHDVLSVS